MSESLQKVFILNNSLAAVSATVTECSALATDGVSCEIFNINEYGAQCGCIPAVRAYRRLRISPSGGFSALGECCDTSVYFLNSRCTEIGQITLSVQADCNERGLGGLVDASVVCQGGELRIVGAFTGGAYLFDQSGRRLTALCKADGNEMLCDFITFGENGCATSTVSNRRQTVSVSENGAVQTSVLSHGYVLRMLFYENGKVYGLFGRNYIYNHIIPIYSDGRLTLPNGENTSLCTF